MRFLDFQEIPRLASDRILEFHELPREGEVPREGETHEIAMKSSKIVKKKKQPFVNQLYFVKDLVLEKCV